MSHCLSQVHALECLLFLEKLQGVQKRAERDTVTPPEPPTLRQMFPASKTVKGALDNWLVK